MAILGLLEPCTQPLFFVLCIPIRGITSTIQQIILNKYLEYVSAINLLIHLTFQR